METLSATSHRRPRRRVAAIVANAVVLVLCGVAGAEPGAPDPNTKEEKSDLPADYQLHDGFFLRGGMFGGFMRDKFVADGPSFFGLRSGSTSGPALGLELVAGRAILPGFGLGAGVIFNWGPGPTDDLVVDDPNRKIEIESQTLIALAAVFNAYLDPAGGLYAEVGAGPARFSVAQAMRAGDWHTAQGSSGYVLFGGIGYDTWTSDEYSVGLLLRGMIGRFEGPDKDPQTGGTGSRSHDVLVAPLLLGTLSFNPRSSPRPRDAVRQ